MAMKMHVDIVSSEGSIFSGQAEQVYANAVMGELGIWPRHAPLLTRLKPGLLRIVIKQTSEQSFFIPSGVIEVQPDVVTVLAEYFCNGFAVTGGFLSNIQIKHVKAEAFCEAN